MKGTKLWGSLLTLGAIGFGLLVLLLFWFNFNIQVEPVAPESPSPTVDNSTPAVSPTTESSPSASPLQPSPTVSASPQSDNLAGKTRAGTLRVGNKTDHPLRVVLLPQRNQNSSPSSAQPQSNDQSPYSEPVHWDFAPEEGSGRGLILSLPDNNLRLQEGDILIAFAQDGSQRYWGPFVVGKTPRPVWNTTDKEWLLMVQ
jgi:hypothetical protein